MMAAKTSGRAEDLRAKTDDQLSGEIADL